MDAKIAEYQNSNLGDFLEKCIAAKRETEKMIIIAHMKFDRSDDRSKINAIKMVRQALGCGLKAAKDFVDDAEEISGITARMSAEKFGMLFAYTEINSTSNSEPWFGLTVTPIKIVEENQAAHEFL